MALAMMAAGALAGCATSAGLQRSTQGPTADEVWLARFVQGYGRAPTFDEQVAWKDATETRVRRYLSSRPDLATSPRASQFTFQRAVTLGMSKAEVLLLSDDHSHAPAVESSRHRTQCRSLVSFGAADTARLRTFASLSPGASRVQ